jgi:hypothetical protein
MESVLCIPRIDINTTNKYILNSLYKLKWGGIFILNEIPLRNDPMQKRILIKVKWNSNTDIKSRIENGDTVNIVHDIDSPWFWKIMRATSDTRLKDACIQSNSNRNQVISSRTIAPPLRV